MARRPIQTFMFGAALLVAACFVGFMFTGIFYATFTPNCTGVAATDTAAVNSLLAVIGSRTGTLKVPWTTAQCKVNDLTIPANVTLDFASNSTGIQVANSKVLTINGPVSAPAGQQIFYNALSGQGSVVINSGQPVYPDWWIANTTPGTTDMLLAFNAAVASLPAAGGSIQLLGTIYNISTVLTITRGDFALRGGSGSQVHLSGSGEPVYINGSALTNGARNVVISDILITGNASATNGLHLRKVISSVFRNVRVANISNAGFLVEHGVLLEFDHPVVSVNDASFTTTPAYGMIFTRNPAVGAGTNSTVNKVTNLAFEGITASPGTAIYADYCDHLTVDVGSPEANTVGYQGTSNSSGTQINGLWGESNATVDILDGGFNGRYTGLHSGKLLHFTSTAYSAQVVGGYYHDITIDSGATSINLDCPAIGTGGTVTDNGTHTRGGYYNVATSTWSTFKSPSLQISGADGTGSKVIAQFNHPGDFNPGDEGQVDFTTGSTGSVATGRIASHYAGGSLWDLYLYTYNGGLSNVAIFGGNGNVTLGGSIGVNGSVSGVTYKTAANCSDSAGAAACGSAAAGAVVIDAATTTVTVSTTAVTANSEIFLTEQPALASRLGITCNTSTGRTYTVTALTAGTSFVITASAAPVTNPACLGYRIEN